jgi:hypothetical protein
VVCLLEVVVAEVWMALNLVVDWFDLCACEDVVDHGTGSITKPDTLDLSTFDEFFHILPN